MSGPSFQQCPECGGEYTLAVARCAECDVALVPGGSVVVPEPEPFPEVAALRCVRVGPLPWTHALSEALTGQGIEHRIERDRSGESAGARSAERFGGEALFGVFVRPEEHADASDIDRQLFAALEPDRAEAAAGDEQCPACGDALPPDVLACPGCGLAFG